MSQERLGPASPRRGDASSPRRRATTPSRSGNAGLSVDERNAENAFLLERCALATFDAPGFHTIPSVPLYHAQVYDVDGRLVQLWQIGDIADMSGDHTDWELCDSWPHRLVVERMETDHVNDALEFQGLHDLRFPATLWSVADMPPGTPEPQRSAVDRARHLLANEHRAGEVNSS